MNYILIKQTVKFARETSKLKDNNDRKSCGVRDHCYMSNVYDHIFFIKKLAKIVWSRILFSRKNIAKYKKFSVSIKKKVNIIGKNREKI